MEDIERKTGNAERPWETCHPDNRIAIIRIEAGHGNKDARREMDRLMNPHAALIAENACYASKEGN